MGVATIVAKTLNGDSGSNHVEVITNGNSSAWVAPSKYELDENVINSGNNNLWLTIC